MAVSGDATDDSCSRGQVSANDLVHKGFAVSIAIASLVRSLFVAVLVRKNSENHDPRSRNSFRTRVQRARRTLVERSGHGRKHEPAQYRVGSIEYRLEKLSRINAVRRCRLGHRLVQSSIALNINANHRTKREFCQASIHRPVQRHSRIFDRIGGSTDAGRSLQSMMPKLLRFGEAIG